MKEFSVSHTQLKRCDLIKLTGRIDASKAQEVKECLDKIAAEGRFRYVLDMSEVEYISSAFLAVLIAAQRNAKRWNRGQVYLAELSERVRSAFELAGLEPLFEFFVGTDLAVGNW